MKQVISSLVSAPRLPRELAIQDLANVNETDSAVVAMIAKVLGGLQSLRLNIANEHDEGNGENDLYVLLMSIPYIQTNYMLMYVEHSVKSLISFSQSCHRSG